MILDSSFRSGRGCSARALTEYVSRCRNFEVRDRNGKVMSQEEIDKFIEKSELKKNNFEREFIVSPGNSRGMAVDNMVEYTREGMDKWLSEGGGRGSVDYVYVIHYADNRNPHVHVAMTGQAKDLKMDVPALMHVQDDVFAKSFNEPELHRGLYKDNPLRLEAEREKGLEEGLERELERVNEL
ncbi:MAG: hypothetical protein L6408_04315 [Nanoarchaeota archaeon]|nr:hypothetical protein [Nanoarchaeota archaeon]